MRAVESLDSCGDCARHSDLSSLTWVGPHHVITETLDGAEGDGIMRRQTLSDFRLSWPRVLSQKRDATGGAQQEEGSAGESFSVKRKTKSRQRSMESPEFYGLEDARARIYRDRFG